MFQIPELSQKITDEMLNLASCHPDDRSVILKLRKKYPDTLLYGQTVRVLRKFKVSSELRDRIIPINRISLASVEDRLDRYSEQLHFGNNLSPEDQARYDYYQNLFEQQGNRIIEISIDDVWHQQPNITELPFELAEFPLLESVRLYDLSSLTSLKNIPSQIKQFWINSSISTEHQPSPPILDFQGMPSQMPNLVHFAVKDCPVISLQGLPLALPKCCYFQIRRSRLMSAENLPNMPNLQLLDLNEGDLRNSAGIPTYYNNRKIKLFLDQNPSISMHGDPFTFQSMRGGLIGILNTRNTNPKCLPISYVKQLRLDRWNSSLDLPDSGKMVKYGPKEQLKLIPYTEHDLPAFNEILTEIYSYFRPSPHSLAIRHAEGERLNQFEIDRIIHEGTYHTVHLLLQRVSVTDPILQNLAGRWQISLHLDNILK